MQRVCSCRQHEKSCCQDEILLGKQLCARQTQVLTIPGQNCKSLKFFHGNIKPVWSREKNNEIVFQMPGSGSSVVSHQHSHSLWSLGTLLRTSGQWGKSGWGSLNLNFWQFTLNWITLEFSFSAASQSSAFIGGFSNT